jgi:hypothetical protein
MQWRPLLPKGGGLIQVDIGGHPPIPTGSHTFHLGSFSFHFGSFFLAFRVLNFWGRFEALNNVFWACHSHTVDKVRV